MASNPFQTSPYSIPESSKTADDFADSPQEAVASKPQAPVRTGGAPTKADLARRASELGVDPDLALSFFTQESSGNWNSRNSPKGAVGGMQVMSGTYKAMMGTSEGQGDPWNNMEAGLRYIAYGQKRLGTKDPELLAAGYHAGYDRKDLREGRIPGTNDGMISTADYARSVAARVRKARGLSGKSDDENPRFADTQEDALRSAAPMFVDTQEEALSMAPSDRKFAGKPTDQEADPSDAKFRSMEKKPEDQPFSSRFTEALAEGYDDMASALGTTAWAFGKGTDEEAAAAMAESLSKQSKRQQTAAQQEIDKAYKAVSDANGVVDTTAAGAKALWASATNPKETSIEIARNAANSLPSLGLGVVGAGGGAAAGAAIGAPVFGVGALPAAITGATWGLRGGMAIGTAATELGAEVREMVQKRLQEQKLEPTAQNVLAIISDKGFKEQARNQGLAKGLTIAAVDQLFMGIGGKITSAPARKIALRELADQGMDIATRTARNKALSSAAGKAAIEAAKPAVAARIGTGVAATAVDAAGESIGEGLSQKVARGEVDYGEALREGVVSLGQSAAQTGIGTTIEGAKVVAKASREKVDVTGTTPSQAAGPFQRAKENAATEPERVIVTAKDGQVTGTVTGQTETGVQVTGDDGQVYQFTTGPDGVKIAPVPEPTPLSNAIETAANDNAATVQQETPETSPAQQVVEEQQAEAPAEPEIVPQPEQPATTEAVAASPEAPPTVEQTSVAQPNIEAPALSEMTEPELRARLKYIAGQAKTNGGWVPMLTKARKEVEREINKRVEQAGQTPAAADQVAQVATRQPSDKLPKDLAGAKPRSAYGKKQFDLTFENDVDKAAYIAAQKTPSKRDADYVKFVMDSTGMTEDEVRAHGAKVRSAIKEMGKNADPGLLTVSDQRKSVQTDVAVSQPAPTVGTTEEGAGATRPPQVATTKTASKEDLDHLFGVDKKRAKAMERIAKGTAFFHDGVKAKDFIKKNGLSETHEVKKGKGGRWDVAPKPELTEKPFDSAAWNKERDDRIKASREAGNIHLDQISKGAGSVETMRGVRIYNVHDPKERGVVRTVDNSGNVYVNWADRYSADKNLATESTEGGKKVFQTSLGQTDFKDYVVGDPAVEAAAPAAQAQQATTDEIVDVKDLYGRTHRVRSSDLDGDKKLIPTFTKDGSRKDMLHRENIDLTGEKKAALDAESAGNPLFDVVTADGARSFKTEAAAKAYATKNGYADTHEVAPASTVSDGATGFVLKRKAKQDAPGTRINGEAERAAADRLEKLHEQMGNITQRNSREGNAKAALRSVIEELRKPKTVVSVVPVLEGAANGLDKNYGAMADVVRDVAAMLDGQNDELDAEMRGYERKAEPQQTSKPERGTVGMKLEAGQVVLTQTGRETTPFPKFDFSTDRKAVNGFKAVNDWLIRNAYEEAVSRGDDFNARQFGAVKLAMKDIPQADKDSAEEYLFGDYVPPVVKSILKPLTDAPKANPAVSENRVFTEDAAAKARALLKSKLNQFNSGIDPEIMQAGITLAGYHIEKGARTFAAYAQAMVADLGDVVKPYLKSWYMGLKYDPRAAGFDGMSVATDVEQADIDAITAQADNPTIAETQEVENGNQTEAVGYPGNRALERALAEQVPGAEEGRNAEQRSPEGGRNDAGRAGRTDSTGVSPGSGVGDGEGTVPVPARGRRSKRGSAGKLGVSAEREAQPDLVRDVEVAQAKNEAPASDYRITDLTRLGEGGQKTKYRNNVAAIRLLNELQSTGRQATAAEQDVLARYVGWGGVSQAFDATNKEWAAEHAELKELLTPEEWDAANESTQYAHYTSQEIIGGIYDAVKRFGFNGGKVLEPGSGVGNFMGLLPEALRGNTRFTAVERERIAGGIAKALYPNHNVQMEDFRRFHAQDGFFDLAIGNPPFASTTLVDLSGRKHLSGLSIHNYFFAKSIDMLREGGVLAMVVSNSFLDAKGDKARRYIGERTEFLGAIRLPNKAFSKNANTDVTTDIIFLKKRPESEWGGKAAKDDLKRWLDVASVTDPLGGDPIPLNQYFVDHPEMMLGRMERAGSMYGPGQPALIARDGQNTDDLMRHAVGRLPEGVFQAAVVKNTADMHAAQAVALSEKANVDVGGHYVEDGKLFVRIDDAAGEKRAVQVTATTKISEKRDLGKNGLERIKALANMRVTVRALLAAEMLDDPKMSGLRDTLNEQYDAFQKEFGYINGRTTIQLFGEDPDFPLLASLEHGYDPGVGAAAAKTQGIKPVPASAKKSPIFTGRVIEKHQEVQKADSPADALMISIAERGQIDADYIGKLLGRDGTEVLDELTKGNDPALFIDPATGGYVLKDAYLSGNVRKKMTQAKAAGMYQNAAALEKVIPEDVPAHEISGKIGAAWIPTETYQEFASEIMGEGTRASVVYVPANSAFITQFTPGSEVSNKNTFGTSRIGADEIFSSLLNSREIKIGHYEEDPVTRSRRFVMEKDATDEANDKAREIKDKFNDWLFADAARAEKLQRAYNDAVNNYVTRVFDGSMLRLPGKVPDSIIRLRRHQRNAVARIIQDGRALLDHVVGAGKAQPLDAKLLTPTGWVLMGDVKVGDYVISQDGTPTKVEAIFPQGNKEIFRVTFSDGAWTECCDEHLWVTQTYRERTYKQRGDKLGKDWDCGKHKVRQLSEIRDTLVAPHLGAKNHSIPMVSSVQFESQPIPVDPYLIGALIGDGHIGENAISITSKDDDLFYSLNLPDGVQAREHDDGTRCKSWRLIGTDPRRNPMLDAVRSLGLAGKLSHEKFVPDVYKFNSHEVRLSVLRGLMDTDGWVEKAGKTTAFTTVSRRLADDVIFLVQSFGGVALETTKTPTYSHNNEKRDGRLAYRLTIKLPADINPFHIARKRDAVVPKTSYAPARYIVSVEPVGQKPAQCIRVAHESHLYVTDDFIVTHNTYTVIAAAMEMKRTGLAKKPLIVVPNHLVKQWAADFYRLYPGANILTATKKDFEKANRRKFLAKIATGNWDAVIMAHSSYGFIKPDPVFEMAFNKARIDEVVAAMESLKDEKDQGSKRTVKQLAKMKEGMENKLASLRDRPMDDLLDFGQLGVDQLMIDEAHCFPADANVITDAGVLKIGEIVENRMQLKVLSVNSSTDALEWKQVTDWFKNSVTHFPVRIHHEGGDFECTANHKIWTYEEGFVEAGSLTDKHTVRLAPVWAYSAAGGEALRALRNGVQLQVVGAGEQRKEAVLLEPVRSELAHDAAEHQGRDHSWVAGCTEADGGAPSREERPEIGGAHAGEQSDAQSGVEGKNGVIAFREDVLVSRRERQDHDAAIDAAQGDGASNGILYCDGAGQGSVQVSAELLQSGSGSAGQEDCHRGGWKDAQAETMEVSGRKEDGSSKRARVVRVEVLERGSDGQLAEGFRDDQSVYCLEVEDNHNFFADGVLVSNSFKNLMYVTKMQNMRGLGQSNGSQRAYDMFIKTHQIYQQNGNGRGVVFATGTPVSNSLAEMYHMLRYLAPEALKDAGHETFDAWAKTFADVEQVWMQSMSGDGYKASNRMSVFVNTPELLRVFSQVADTVTIDDIKTAYSEENNGKEFPIPPLKGGRRTPVSIPRSQAQTEYMDEIARRAKALEQRRGKPQKGDDNMLSIMGDARKAAMDIRMVRPDVAERDPNGRIAIAARNIFERYKQYDAVKGTQLVFSDMGTPKKHAAKELAEYNELMEAVAPLSDDNIAALAEAGDESAISKIEKAEEEQRKIEAKGADWLDAIKAAMRGFSIYDDMKDALVEMGVPEKEIAFIHDYNTDDQKAALFRAVNDGKVRVLLGSTEKMGAGTNVQQRAVALHHLDVPWKPSDIEQREGRVIRQGNSLIDKDGPNYVPGFEVEVMAYATQDTLDLFMWQTQEKKLSMIGQLRTGNVGREVDNAFEEMQMSAGEMQAAATSNPYLLEEIQLKDKIKKLERKKRSFDGQKNDIANRLARAKRDVQELPEQIKQAAKVEKAATETLDRIASDFAAMTATVNGKTVNGAANIRDALRDAIAASPKKDGDKPDIKIEFNGKTYTSESGIGEAIIKTLGDAAEVEITLPDGKTLRRSAEFAGEMTEALLAMPDNAHPMPIGKIGPFEVEAYRMRDTIEAVMSLNGDDIASVEMIASDAGMLMNALRGLPLKLKQALSNQRGVSDYTRQKLEKAKRAVADIEKMPGAGEWDGEAELKQARQDYKAILKKLAERTEQTEAEQPAGEQPAFSRLESVFSALDGDGRNRIMRVLDYTDEAEIIRYIDKNFVDILGELDDAGRVKIEC